MKVDFVPQIAGNDTLLKELRLALADLEAPMHECGDLGAAPAVDELGTVRCLHANPGR